jgi:phosphopantothenoylcysteine decarboxylase/phosphopantothenate--cysteine ligase
MDASMTNRSQRLAGKVIVVGVTGGVAAFKAAHLVTELRKLGAEVHAVMTAAATQFVSPLTFRAVSQHPVVTDLWDAQNADAEPHITMGERADLYVIAPATAHTLAKLALGLADDVVTATALATRAPVLVAPAMSDTMYEQPTTQEHLQTLRRRGVQIIGPVVGWLASGKEAIGRMAEPEAIVEEICAVLEAK